MDGETYARSKVTRISQATLTNTEKIVIEYEPDAHVGRYIMKSEISRIFEARDDASTRCSDLRRLLKKMQKSTMRCAITIGRMHAENAAASE